ncbi:MAG: hypothetical protein WAK86_05870 [Pseudonocardiaceae bacterium]
MNAGARLRLDHAERLLTGADLAGVWPRCTAWLLRLALEHALAHLWMSRYPEVNSCPMRAQLLALTKVVDTDTQHRASELWQTLSRAGHHHHYELSPTAAELRTWLAEARVIVTQLDNAAE